MQCPLTPKIDCVIVLFVYNLKMHTPVPESMAMRLGLGQSLTFNVYGGEGGAGGPSHGQAPGGQGGHGDGPTVNNYFTMEQTQDLISKLNYAKDAGVRASKACLPGTRVKLLSRIRNWALYPAQRTLLLYGAAGTGKSAIAHTIARDLDSEKLALVPFFAFSRSVQNRSSSQLIPTWAKRLAELHPPYQAYLHGLQLSDLESTDLVHQQDVLFLKGLASLSNHGKAVVFIVDALDECPKEEAEDLFSILEELVCKPTLPVFARFLVTSRSHGEILETFESAPSILHINIDDEKETVQDINKFVNHKLHKPKVQHMAGLYYACLAAGHHLRNTLPTTSEINSTPSIHPDIIYNMTYFLDNNFLFWLEAHSCMDTGKDGPGTILAQFLEWSMGIAENGLRTILLDYIQFEKRFRQGYMMSAPQVYISGLVFVPQESIISQKYRSRFRNLIQASGSLDTVWPTSETLVIHEATGVRSVAFAPDGLYIASGSGTNIRIWDVKTGQQVGEPLIGHTDSVQDKTICLWDVKTGKQVDKPLNGHTDWVRTIRLWDVKTGQQVDKPLFGHIGWVQSVAFSSDGSHIVTGSDDRTVRLWDVKTGQQVGKPLSGHNYCVQSVAFSPDGTYIASGSDDRTICQWEVKTGQQVGKPLVGHIDWVQSVAFSPDGSHIASGSDDKTIRIWDVRAGQQVGEPLIGHTNYVQSVAFSPDGSHIVSGSNDKTIRIWDVRTKQQVSEPLISHTNYVWSVAFLPNGSHIASGSSDKTIRIWDVKTGQQVGEPFVGHTDSVWSVAFSPDGSYIASGSRDDTICLWEVKTGQQIGKPLIGHTHWVQSVTFSPDGSHIASGSYDRTICLWDVKTGWQVGEPLFGHTGGIQSVAFSPDGSHIVSGSGDKTIRIWDVKTGQQVSKPLVGHIDWVRSVAFSPDGSHIVSGSDDRTVRLWDVKTGQQVGKSFVGHTYWVQSVAFSPDGSHIVSGSYDRTIRLWDVKTGRQVGKPLFGHTGWVQSVAFSADGRHTVSGSWDKTIRLWDITTEQSTNFPAKHSDVISSVILEDGWFETINHESHALWVPHAFRQHLFNYYPPWPMIICAQPQIKLELTNAVLGSNWAMILNRVHAA
ncbi:TPR-like protein [Mycena sanguinolenta]|uniref:TPR-like protein n=1 Tax=Mycena sanguinolenta TaxID=230812 RepID=A0A8H6Y0B9_9AGAR|nr:TPR-like protein [Mycena sanguinolenta]